MIMVNQVKVGIIGTGGVGEVLLQAFENSPLTKVMGVNDNNFERAMDISNRYHIPVYRDYKEMIESNDIQLIYVAVPPKYHHEIALDVIKGKKHILCEKPLANSLQESMEMAEEAEKNQVVHVMNFPTIYRPAFKAIEEHVKEGSIGELKRIELQCYFPTWPRVWQKNSWIDTREQGGFIREVFPHYIQIIQRIFGTMIIESSTVHYPEQKNLCETGIMATALLEDGTPILLNAVSNVGMEESIHFTLYGSKGTMSLVNWRDLWMSRRGNPPEKVELLAEDHLQCLITDIVKAMNGEPSTVVTFKDGHWIQDRLEKLLNFRG